MITSAILPDRGPVISLSYAVPLVRPGIYAVASVSPDDPLHSGGAPNEAPQFFSLFTKRCMPLPNLSTSEMSVLGFLSKRFGLSMRFPGERAVRCERSENP